MDVDDPRVCMEFTGDVRMAATPEEVWAVITDPEELTKCVSGAEDVTRVDEKTYEGRISRSIAGFSLTLDGELEIVEQVPYEHLAASVSAGDNSAGSGTKAIADAEMELNASRNETVVRYAVTADVKGRLASLGSSLVGLTLESDIETYFENIEELPQAQ
jgi:carbon monoxide dehydrogenase subunit G